MLGRRRVSRDPREVAIFAIPAPSFLKDIEKIISIPRFAGFSDRSGPRTQTHTPPMTTQDFRI